MSRDPTSNEPSAENRPESVEIRPESVTIRPGQQGDLAEITTLYNHYIAHTPITFDTEPYENRDSWFTQFAETGAHRLWVAVASERVLGFACSTVFRPKAAYSTSVETTIYCTHSCTTRGVGTRLYTALFESLASEDVHRAYAGITIPNAASIAIHERFGFQPVATFHEVGRKFGRYWDVVWYEKRLTP